MKLYYAPGACSLSPHIALRETGQKFDLVKVDLGTHKTEKGANYYEINPKGAVPALELDSGQILTEGAAIVQYIGDHAPNSGIMPKAGTMERYREQEWLNWVATELHKGMGSLFNKELAEKAGDVIRKKVDGTVAHLDKHLAKNEFILGKSFTAVDAYAYTVLGWGKYTGVDVSKHKNVTAFVGRVESRPAVQAALKAEGN